MGPVFAAGFSVRLAVFLGWKRFRLIGFNHLFQTSLRGVIFFFFWYADDHPRTRAMQRKRFTGCTGHREIHIHIYIRIAHILHGNTSPLHICLWGCTGVLHPVHMYVCEPQVVLQLHEIPAAAGRDSATDCAPGWPEMGWGWCRCGQSSVVSASGCHCHRVSCWYDGRQTTDQTALRVLAFLRRTSPRRKSVFAAAPYPCRHRINLWFCVLCSGGSLFFLNRNTV